MSAADPRTFVRTDAGVEYDNLLRAYTDLWEENQRLRKTAHTGIVFGMVSSSGGGGASLEELVGTITRDLRTQTDQLKQANLDLTAENKRLAERVAALEASLANADRINEEKNGTIVSLQRDVDALKCEQLHRELTLAARDAIDVWFDYLDVPEHLEEALYNGSTMWSLLVRRVRGLNRRRDAYKKQKKALDPTFQERLASIKAEFGVPANVEVSKLVGIKDARDGIAHCSTKTVEDQMKLIARLQDQDWSQFPDLEPIIPVLEALAELQRQNKLEERE